MWLRGENTRLSHARPWAPTPALQRKKVENEPGRGLRADTPTGSWASVAVGTAATEGRAASAEGSAVGGSKGQVGDDRDKEAAGTE